MIFIFPSIGQPCSLFCKPKDPQYRFSAKLASKVIDGTSCSSGSIDICIDGRCQVSLFDLCHMEYLESEILRRRRRKVVMVACAFIKLSSIALFNRIRIIALVFPRNFPSFIFMSLELLTSGDPYYLFCLRKVSQKSISLTTDQESFVYFVQYPLVLPPVINSCVIFLIQDVGCDFKIGSGAQEDICGVCKGNGTTCRTVEGRFNQLAGSGNPAEKKKKKKKPTRNLTFEF